MTRDAVKRITGYSCLLFFVLAISTFILVYLGTNTTILLIVKLLEFVFLVLFLIYFYRKYIKPIEKATITMDKILQGNYHARVHYFANGTVGELSRKINALARSLSELTIQEQIQAEQLSTVIENSESGLALIDEKGYIHVVNRKFSSMFGKDPEAYIGYLYYDVLEIEQIHQTVQESFLFEQNVKKIFSITKDREKVHFEVVGAPIFNERNHIKGAVLVIYDITEFKNIETMRKDFVANVSHELKTPITSIKGFAETLLSGAGEDKTTRDQFLHIIYEESNRIQYLIDDLLTLSSLEKEDPDLHMTKIEPRFLVNDILPIIEQQAKKEQINVSVTIDEDCTFEADEEKIKQVLLNLLTNAVSYTHEGGEVSLSIKAEDDTVAFYVKDTGIGISKEDLPRLFERFYRVDKARSRQTGGTGLGLAIVKHIVEIHKGTISVESELNKGSTFKVTLPK